MKEIARVGCLSVLDEIDPKFKTGIREESYEILRYLSNRYKGYPVMCEHFHDGFCITTYLFSNNEVKEDVCHETFNDIQRIVSSRGGAITDYGDIDYCDCMEADDEYFSKCGYIPVLVGYNGEVYGGALNYGNDN